MRFNYLAVVCIYVLMISVTPAAAHQIEQETYYQIQSISDGIENYHSTKIDNAVSENINGSNISVESNEDKSDEFKKKDRVGLTHKILYWAAVILIVSVYIVGMAGGAIGGRMLENARIANQPGSICAHFLHSLPMPSMMAGSLLMYLLLQ